MDDKLEIIIEDNALEVAQNLNALSKSITSFKNNLSPMVSSLFAYNQNMTKLKETMRGQIGENFLAKKETRANLDDTIKTLESFAKQLESVGDTKNLDIVNNSLKELYAKKNNYILEDFNTFNSVAKVFNGTLQKSKSYENLKLFKNTDKDLSLVKESLDKILTTSEKVKKYTTLTNVGNVDKTKSYSVERKDSGIQSSAFVEQARLDAIEQEKINKALEKRDKLLAKILKLQQQISVSKEAEKVYKATGDVEKRYLAQQNTQKLEQKLAKTTKFDKYAKKQGKAPMNVDGEMQQLEVLMLKLKELGANTSVKDLRQSIAVLNKEKLGGLKEELVALEKHFDEIGNKDISASIKNAIKNLDNYSISAAKGTKSTSKFVDSMKGINNTLKYVRLDYIINLFQRLANVVSGGINASKNYIETLNLFKVAMGESIVEGEKFIGLMESNFGLDPKVLMEYMGAFTMMSRSMGLTQKNAYVLGETFTKLGVDISSLYNIEVDEAMTKLRSALAGETEPVRQLGFDISETAIKQEALTLSTEALANGNEQLAAQLSRSVSTMTYSEKVQLRYSALLRQSALVQGDYARTMEQTANQMKIYDANVQQLSRAFGNILIPTINLVIPYLIAFLQVLRDIAEFIAGLVNFELPEVDYSSLNNVGNQMDAVEESTNGATAAVEEFKKQLLGVDEINNITPPNEDKGGSGGNFDSGLGGFELDLEGYNNLLDTVTASVEDLKKKLLPFIGILGTLIGLLGTIKAFQLYDTISKLPPLGKKLTGVFGGLLLVLTGLSLTNISKDMDLFAGAITSAIGGILVSIGSITGALALFGKTGLSLGASLGSSISVINLLLTTYTGVEKVIEANKQLSPTIRDIEEAMKGYNKQLELSTVNAQADAKNQRLLKETLLDYVDANGKVIEGEEQRANGTLAQINKELGTQYEIVNGQLTLNGEILNSEDAISNSIEERIKLKEKEAYIDAYNEIRKKAIMEQIELQNSINSKQQKLINLKERMRITDGEDFKQAEKAYNAVKKQLDDEQQSYKDLGDEIELYGEIVDGIYTSNGETMETVVSDVTKKNKEVAEQNANTQKTIFNDMNSEAKKGAEQAQKDINTTLGGIKDPKVKLGVNTDDASFKLNSIFGGLSTIIPNFKLPTFRVFGYANGGFPEDGWFRASHGEMIGKFDNGQSVVANNNQIVNGIKNGVYDAMMSVMSSQNTSGSGNVYLNDNIVGVIAKGINDMASNNGNNPIGFRMG